MPLTFEHTPRTHAQIAFEGTVQQTWQCGSLSICCMCSDDGSPLTGSDLQHLGFTALSRLQQMEHPCKVTQQPNQSDNLHRVSPAASEASGERSQDAESTAETQRSPSARSGLEQSAPSVAQRDPGQERRRKKRSYAGALAWPLLSLQHVLRSNLSPTQALEWQPCQ